MTPRKGVPHSDHQNRAEHVADWNPDAQRKASGPRPGSARHRRFAARFAAVQALYQLEITGTTVVGLIEEYCQHRLSPGGNIPSCESLGPADEETFTSTVQAAELHKERIDGAIRNRLREDWTSERLDPVLRAALRAAGGELVAGAVKPGEVFRDYTDLARAFGGGAREIGFTNAMLEAIAAELEKTDSEPRV